MSPWSDSLMLLVLVLMFATLVILGLAVAAGNLMWLLFRDWEPRRRPGHRLGRGRKNPWPLAGRSPAGASDSEAPHRGQTPPYKR